MGEADCCVNTPLLMCERHDSGDVEGVCTTVSRLARPSKGLLLLRKRGPWLAHFFQQLAGARIHLSPPSQLCT